jgi:hypothetical protein
MPNDQRQQPRPSRAQQTERKVAERAASTPDGAPTGGPKKPGADRRMGGPTPRKEHER